MLKEKSIHHHTDPNQMVFLKGFHKFLKASFAKTHFQAQRMGQCSSYGSSVIQLYAKSTLKEAPFFVMFGRDAVTNIGHITVPRYRYMGTEDLILDLEIMSNNLPMSNYQSSAGETSSTQTEGWEMLNLP